MRLMKRPWHIVITRYRDHGEGKDVEDLEDIVIGPFHEKRKALKHIDSPDVDDWCMDQAKQERYIVDDVFLTRTPEIPSYGINEPVY